MSLLSKIRRLRFRDGLSISEVARRTGLSRNTVKRWLAASAGAEPKYLRSSGPTVLTPFEERLRQRLESDARRAKRERRTALALYGELRVLGYSGSYSPGTAFVRRWRAQGAAPVRSAFVPLKFTLGEAFQFDRSEESLVIGGLHRKLLLAHVKLCASRASLLVAYPTQRYEMLFDAHARAFRVFGGVPKRGIYDNMKTAVDRVGVGKRRIVNTRFAAMTAHYLFEPHFCNIAAGWEKGVVEKNVQDSRRRVWQDATRERFGTISELNVWLEARCLGLWATLAHPDAEHLTVADALTLERDALMPMVPPFDGYVETIATVSSTCLVRVERNKVSGSRTPSFAAPLT